jgi:hypothetical protein
MLSVTPFREKKRNFVRFALPLIEDDRKLLFFKRKKGLKPVVNEHIGRKDEFNRDCAKSPISIQKKD